MRAELHKSLVADEKIHELLRFTISTNVKKDVEQPYNTVMVVDIMVPTHRVIRSHKKKN